MPDYCVVRVNRLAADSAKYMGHITANDMESAESLAEATFQVGFGEWLAIEEEGDGDGASEI